MAQVLSSNLKKKTNAHTLHRWDKIEVAFKITKLGVNEQGALSLECTFILTPNVAFDFSHTIGTEDTNYSFAKL